MAKLGVPPRQSDSDLVSILQQSRAFETDAQALAAKVLESPQFRRWIRSNVSDYIYVEGRLDSSIYGKTSPVSYFSSSLVEVLSGANRIIKLYFFCSRHVASNQDVKGPRGLVRSLLAQLLQMVLRRWPNKPMEVEELESLRGECRADVISTENLCQVFRRLLHHIPRQTAVFCIIDDVSRFERDEWYGDYASLMNMLSSIVSEPGTVRFKVLMTSPTKSKWLRDRMVAAQRIEIGGSSSHLNNKSDKSLWKAVGDLTEK